jgi:hypothetical protein
MKRFRLAAWATVVGLGLASGCSTFGGGSSSGSGSPGFFSRLFHRNNNCEMGCPCDMGCCGSSGFGGFGGCCGPGGDGGPMVMDPWSGGMPSGVGGLPPGAVAGPGPGALTGPGPGTLAPEGGVPTLAPPPRIAPQAQPFPAGPVGRAK